MKESASMSGGARVVSCSGCSNLKASGYIGASNGSVGGIRWSSINSPISTRTTLRLKHQAGLPGSPCNDGADNLL